MDGPTAGVVGCYSLTELVLRECVVRKHERCGRRHYRHRTQASQARGRLDEEVGHGHPEDSTHAGGREQARDEWVHLRLQQPLWLLL